jgi:hypothetical protein
LAGPDGLTERASTFARQDVLVALGAGLAGVGRTELEALADRFLAERAVSVVADRALGRSAAVPAASWTGSPFPTDVLGSVRAARLLSGNQNRTPGVT